MANITLTRVDFRLVHGQIVVKWSKVAKANKIVVVDDAVAKDELQRTVFKMAAPPGVKVLCYSNEKCIDKWNEKQFGEGNVMVLFKSVESCYKAWKAGYPLPALQLGNSPKEKDKKMLGNEVYVNEKELEYLKEMADKGTEIVIHTIPETKSISFEKAISKL